MKTLCFIAVLIILCYLGWALLENYLIHMQGGDP